MNNLIAMGNSSSATMTSREISELVESRHNDVKRSIERLMEKGVIQSTPTANFRNINNVEGQEYVFTGEQGKRDSIIVVAQLSPEFTARLVDRWQELENRLSVPITPEMQIANAMLIAGRMIEEQKLLLEQRDKLISDIQPKAAALDHITMSDGAVCLQTASKVLGFMKQKDCFKWMHEKRMIFRRGGDWIAHQDRLRAGILEEKTHTIDRTDGTKTTRVQALVTPKGLARMATMLQMNPPNYPIIRKAA